MPSREYSKKYPSAPGTMSKDKFVVCTNPFAGSPIEVVQEDGAAGAVQPPDETVKLALLLCACFVLSQLLIRQ